LGHTRAGKTSLLRVIAGLDRPTSGAVKLGGADITRTTVRRRSVAMVYQQFINYPSLTVRDNIASPLRLQKAAATQGIAIAERVRELAAMLRIDGLLDRLPGELSGGQKQRVAIARALAKGADFLLLDEPLVNLDYKLREGLRDELRAIFAEHATTVLYATTEPAEALALGGHTILMHEGRVLQHAPTLDIYHRPSSVAAARVFSDPPMNIVPVAVAGGVAELSPEVRIALGDHAHLGDLPDGAYHLGIRASDCAVGPTGGGRVAGQDPGDPAQSGVDVRARVELCEISGSETFVYLRHGELTFVVQQDGAHEHALDDELIFTINPKKLMAFARGRGAGRDNEKDAKRDTDRDDDRDGGALVASYHRGSPPLQPGRSG
jgi:glycerol transport system ATP-binding protein